MQAQVHGPKWGWTPPHNNDKYAFSRNYLKPTVYQTYLLILIEEGL